MKDYDIAIVGSGLVGMTLALALSRLPLKTILIEAKPKREYKLNQGKAIALNYASISLLKNLNVWDKLSALSTPIEKVHVSERGRFGRVQLSADEIGLPALGCLIRESNLSASMVQSIQEKITWLHDTRLTAVKKNNRLVLENDQGGQEINCRLLIACDGVASKVRQLLDIQIEEKPYQHSALVSQVQLTRSHFNTAYERFTSEGTIAMLPLQDNQCAVVITAENDKIDKWLQLSDDMFLEHLQKLFGYRLGRLQSIGKRLHFPLKMLQAKEQIKPGVVLLGHSAHVMHPVAAQGLNLSFRDIALFIDLLQEAIQKQKDIAEVDWLKCYAKIRMKDQKYTMRFTQLLVDIFSSDTAIINRYRKLGILGIELTPPIKRLLTIFGAGFSGKVASLLKSS